MIRDDEIKLYGLLEKMLKSAEEGDRKEVIRLNKSIEPFIAEEHDRYHSQIGRDYDNCRQCCVMSFTAFSSSPGSMIADARKRFSEIKKPY